MISTSSNLKRFARSRLLPHLRRLPGQCWHKPVFQLELFQWEHTPQVTALQLKKPILSKFCSPQLPRISQSHLFHYEIYANIFFNLKTRPPQKKKNMSWNVLNRSLCQNPGHLQSLSGSKVLTPSQNHTQATQSLVQSMQCRVACHGKELGRNMAIICNNALRYHCKIGFSMQGDSWIGTSGINYNRFEDNLIICFWMFFCESDESGLILFIASQLDTAVQSILAHRHQLHLAWKSLTILQQWSSVHRHGVAAAWSGKHVAETTVTCRVAYDSWLCGSGQVKFSSFGPKQWTPWRNAARIPISNQSHTKTNISSCKTQRIPLSRLSSDSSVISFFT